MKKVRILLSAVAVLAIVGGALAFKAKSPSTFCVYQTLNCTSTSPCSFIAVSDDATVISPTGGCGFVLNKVGNCPSSVSASLCIAVIAYDPE